MAFLGFRASAGEWQNSHNSKLIEAINQTLCLLIATPTKMPWERRLSWLLPLAQGLARLQVRSRVFILRGVQQKK
jgi:hypothetical protein